MATVDTLLMSTGVTSFENRLFSTRKASLCRQLSQQLFQNTQIVVFSIDHIPTPHIQALRSILRNQLSATLVCGKNTMMRHVFNLGSAHNQKLVQLIPYLKGNVGCIFASNCDLLALRKIIEDFSATVNTKPGMIAPCDVVIKKGISGLTPEKTSFFAALSIPTKIVKGQVELLKDVPILSAGEIVTESIFRLMELLKLKPFKYSMEVKALFDNGDLIDLDAIKLFEHAFIKGLQNILGLQVRPSGVPSNQMYEPTEDFNSSEPDNCDCCGINSLFGDDEY
eukprot:TRINITY_DN1635_c0_g1_i3.p1 TRINITY_DN1635_c0_g1~~TRINITY_DN1635_c0_g1_i3.p1  ORF type:complete len:281 (-),score=47.23 TRINITY_DN1635_c0_g1_i3:56-898(-)